MLIFEARRSIWSMRHGLEEIEEMEFNDRLAIVFNQCLAVRFWRKADSCFFSIALIISALQQGAEI